MKNIILKINVLMDKCQSLSLLLIRLILAYGFYEPAMKKWADLGATAEWFGYLGIPFPTLNAFIAASVELGGVVLLIIGLGVRYISLPLMGTMVVAIGLVHWDAGFSVANQGFEIPLYYLLMLFILVTHGGGKYSLDNILSKKCEMK